LGLIEGAAANILGDIVQKLLGIQKEITMVKTRFEATRYHQTFADTIEYSGQYRDDAPTWVYTVDSIEPRTIRELNVIFEDEITDDTHKPHIEIVIDHTTVLTTLGGNPYKKGFPSINFRNGKLVRRDTRIEVWIWNKGTDHATKRKASIFFALGEV